MRRKLLVLLTLFVLLSLWTVPASMVRAQHALIDHTLAVSGPCQVVAGQVVINEVFPSPSNNGQEWVELYNTTSTTVGIGNCVLDDIPGASPAYQVPASTFIAPRGFWILNQVSYFNNTGGSVRFLKENGTTLLDSYTYGATANNVSWYRLPDGGSWAASPTASITKGQSNTIPFYPIVSSSTRADTNPTSANNVRFILRFSKPVTGVDTSFPFNDLALHTTGVTGAQITAVSGSGTTYTITVSTGTGNGSIRLVILDNDSIRDAGNRPLGGAGIANGNFTSGQAYTVTGRVTISGNAGVAGVTLNYTGGSTLADSSGNYSFSVLSGWSGTVTPSKSNHMFSPASTSYSNVTANQTAQNYTATLIYSIFGNTSVAGVTLRYTTFGTPKTVLSQTNGSYVLKAHEGWSGTVTPFHDCFTFSPASQDYNTLSGNQTNQNYTPSFNSGSGCADIGISVHGVHQGRFALPPEGSTRVNFVGLNNGPVQIESTNTVPIIGAERLIYKAGGVNTSFSEMMGLPAGQLDQVYWLPWYNNKDLDTQLRIANATNNPATVTITIDGVAMDPLNLDAGESTRVSYPLVNAGPVKIESDQDIVAAERIIYKVNGINTSFSEMMALPANQLDNTYWLPWYNSKDLDTQLRIANVTENLATVTITIGGIEMAPLNLDAGESTRVSYPLVNAGPVKIESDQNIVAAARVIYKVNNANTSFSEMMAQPNSQLDTTYWLPWYNNVELDTQLRIANVTENPATVTVTIGGMATTPLNLAAGESTRVSYPSINAGPVTIESDQNIVVAERVIYKVNNVNTSFSEMMALPNIQLDSTYWFPWYNNKDLDTQLRFGVP